MRMPTPHVPFPVCQVYLTGCGCGWMLGETLMELWKREKAWYYNRGCPERGEQRGTQHTQILLDQTLYPQHPDTKTRRSKVPGVGKTQRDGKRKISDIETHSHLAGSPTLGTHLPRLAGMAETHQALIHQAPWQQPQLEITDSNRQCSREAKSVYPQASSEPVSSVTAIPHSPSSKATTLSHWINGKL